MNARDALREFIQREIVADHTVQLRDGDDLLLSGLIDSLGVIRLVTFTQEHFGVEIPPEDVVIEHFATIEAIHQYLQMRGVH